jgi:putative protein-disulfide isomerase
MKKKIFFIAVAIITTCTIAAGVLPKGSESSKKKEENTNQQMDRPQLIYVYDALCGWCFGFSPTMKKIKDHYGEKMEYTIRSGGLRLPPNTGPIGVVAPYIKTAYKDVENACGVKFGDKFVNGTLAEGTMVLNSLPPAIALCIMKERYPDKAFEFGSLLHDMIYVDGNGTEDYSVYGQYAAKLGYDEKEFNAKMNDPHYLKLAQMDFEAAQQLGATSFPTVLIEKNGFVTILFRGYLPFERAKAIIDEHVK